MVRTVDQALAYLLNQSLHGPRFGEGECQEQCHLAYDIPTDGTPTAADWWAKSAHKHPTSDPSTAPRGAFHYFIGGSAGDGHVMISQGGSSSWSTDIARAGYFDTTSVEAVLRTWTALRYVGWTEDIDGVRVLIAQEDPVTERRAVDYSMARPSLATIKARGYIGIGRYLGGSQSKWLTKAEAAAARALDLDIWLVYESTATRALEGKAAGVADAKAAEAQAKALGYPKGSVIFFAVDTDTTAAAVRAYFDGVKAGLTDYEAGDYGGVKITEGGLTGWHWQTAAWSGGALSPKAHLYQRVKPNGPLPAGCDENVYCRDFPRWTSTPPPPPKDWFDMATQADLEAAIVKHIPDIVAAVLDAAVTNRNPDGTSSPMKLSELLSQIEVAEDRLGARLRDVRTALTDLGGVSADVAAIRAKIVG